MLNSIFFFDLLGASVALFWYLAAAGPRGWCQGAASRSCAQGAVKLRNFVGGEILELGNISMPPDHPPKTSNPASGRGEHMFGKRSCVNAAWRFIGAAKKKKKRSPLILYHTLVLKVKSFSRNFFKKFQEKQLLFGRFCDIIIIEKRKGVYKL